MPCDAPVTSATCPARDMNFSRLSEWSLILCLAVRTWNYTRRWFLAGRAQRPNENFESAGKEQRRWARGQVDSGSGIDCVGFEFRSSAPQWPLLMMDLAAQDLLVVRGVETVALGEPVFERSFFAKASFCGRTIPPPKFCGTAVTTGGIVNATFDLGGIHFGVEIGQAVKRPSGPDRGQVGSVETEKIYSGLAAMGHIGADIELGKMGKARQRRESAGVDAAHVEGDDPDPALAVESIEREL